jgi:hypothetical protein
MSNLESTPPVVTEAPTMSNLESTPPVVTEAPTMSSVESTPWFQHVLEQLYKAPNDTPGALLFHDTTGDKSATMKTRGMDCSIKNVYEGPSKCRCCTNWIEAFPDDAKESVEETEDSQRHALVVRNRKSHGSKRSMEIDSIVIQSPVLKSILENVFSGYPGVTPGLANLTFSAPFTPFFYRQNELEQATKQQGDQLTSDHLNLLYTTIAAELMDTFRAQKDFVSHGVITFEYIWTLFKPGNLVYSKVGGQKRVFRTTNEPRLDPCLQDHWIIPCEYVDWDGEAFGLESVSLSIQSFTGTKAILQLEAYPLEFHPTPTELKERLVTRGQKFESLKGQHYKNYKGIATQGSDKRYVSCHSSCVEYKLTPDAWRSMDV